MSKEQTYAVLSPLLRNGESFKPGSKVKMLPTEAEALIAAGVLAEAQPLPTDDDDGGDAGAGREQQKGKKGK